MAKKRTKVILALIILLFAFLSGTLWAKGWNDEVSRSRGVMVFFTTYQELQPQDRQLIINDLRCMQIRRFAFLRGITMAKVRKIATKSIFSSKNQTIRTGTHRCQRLLYVLASNATNHRFSHSSIVVCASSGRELLARNDSS